MNKSQQIATITLAAAKKMAQAVEAKALEINVPVVFSVVDHGGNTLLIQRMDDAFVTSCDISLNKAYTACCLRQGTHEITDAVQQVPLYMACSSPINNELLFLAAVYLSY